MMSWDKSVPLRFVFLLVCQIFLKLKLIMTFLVLGDNFSTVSPLLLKALNLLILLMLTLKKIMQFGKQEDFRIF